MSVRERDNPVLFAKVQAQNLLRQYDLLTNCIEIGLEKGALEFPLASLVSCPVEQAMGVEGIVDAALR